MTETFRLDAPPERVWRYLLDPERVVLCLPGASLDEVVDEGTYEGSVRVSVGPVTVTYRGRMVFEEVDDEARRVRMGGKGRESTGSGSATMSMVGTVAATGDGGSEVTVESDVRVSGKIVRFGRGMIERVSREIFNDFAACMAETLEREGEAPEGEAPEDEEAEAPEGEAPEDEEAEARSAAAGGAPAEALSGEGLEGPSRPREAARGLTFLWRAFRSWLRDVFRDRDE